jgi:crotonobetainyl-CoA:carnitine CoA-transferase CaiB-like acyl-CoA transferase
VRALGAPELLDDALFATPRERRRNGADLVARIDALTARHTRAEWAETFRRHDVWWAPINSVEDLLSDAQVLASGAFVRVPGTDGALPDEPNGVATPVDFGATPAAPAGAPPAVGADADALLDALGVDAAARQALRDKGVLR